MVASCPRDCCVHDVLGEALVADPSGVLVWPARKTLIVADLQRAADA